MYKFECVVDQLNHSCIVLRQLIKL